MSKIRGNGRASCIYIKMDAPPSIISSLGKGGIEVYKKKLVGERKARGGGKGGGSISLYVKACVEGSSLMNITGE